MLHVLLYILTCFIHYSLFHQEVSSAKGGPCTALHAKGQGVSIACCSRTQKLARNCQFQKPQWCRSKSCHCYLHVNSEQLNCTLTSSLRDASVSNFYAWEDHKNSQNQSFVCRKPNFPNENAGISMFLDYQEGNLMLAELLDFVEHRRVVSLELNIARPVYELDYQVNILEKFPHLRHLKIEPMPQTTKSFSEIFKVNLEFMQRLEVLVIRNFENATEKSLLDQTETNCSVTLRRIHLENLPNFQSFPTWISKCRGLEIIYCQSTALQRPEDIMDLQALQQLHLSRNSIRDLDTVSFMCPKLLDIDLSRNQIERISQATFSDLPRLRFLDLSDNPIKTLPVRVFENLSSLRWLRLQRLGLRHLMSANLLGLSSLRDVSLQGNQNVVIEPFALLHLPALETLDLRHCNLSVIPEAATQACQLKHLWLNFNLLHAPSAIPPETVIQLTRLRQLVLSENPLLTNPPSLFLLPRENEALISSLMTSLQQLPAWWGDPCTPYSWWRHLVEDNHFEPVLKKNYRKFFASRFDRKLGKGVRRRCSKKYQDDIRSLEAYKSIVVNGRCESIRRLRSSLNHQGSSIMSPPSTSRETDGPEIVIRQERQLESCEELKLVLMGSLFLNALTILFTCLYCSLKVTKKFCWK